MSRSDPSRPKYGAPADGYVRASNAARRLQVAPEIITGNIGKIPGGVLERVERSDGTIEKRYWVPLAWVEVMRRHAEGDGA